MKPDLNYLRGIGTAAPVDEFATRTSHAHRPSRISPELIAMMRNFVDAIENNSDPTIPLDLLRHSIEIAYDRLR